ncbi:Uncharacterized protein FWK35_00011351, partial [Aphis craccivora]
IKDEALNLWKILNFNFQVFTVIIIDNSSIKFLWDLTFNLSLLDSERTDECIDFTMIITSRNYAPISSFGGGFRCKSEYLWCIIEAKN